MPNFPRTLTDAGVLFDTGAFVGLYVADDPDHANAVACSDLLFGERRPLFVSMPVICETHKRLMFDVGYRVAHTFLSAIFDGSWTVLHTISADEPAAADLVRLYNYLGLGLVDALNVVVMRRVGLTRIFAFDDDYLWIPELERIPPIT